MTTISARVLYSSGSQAVVWKVLPSISPGSCEGMCSALLALHLLSSKKLSKSWQHVPAAGGNLWFQAFGEVLLLNPEGLQSI